ncbi:ADP-ribose diphosphatase [Echinimonas agarilytica]|uniref:ADP-ribose pyrophosphatase n=1 Tax=Echinimonas agarilytica TaxID=1215918 RepID=A0AA41W8Q6_9GAMM|nr:ADP-ribose diphosphatase [Echinimonas agarilytica]MCM2680391.1 ADP-ribose diphosphatase [Echinimonas agarilytica]
MVASEFDKSDVEIVRVEKMSEGFFTMNNYMLKHRLFAGGWTPVMSREMMERGHAAALLPYDPVRDEVVILEQFRLGAVATSDHPWLLELVAGIIEPGETAEGVAIRESEEEAGLTVVQTELICSYLPSPGGCNERLTLFAGHVNSSNAGGLHGLASEHEDIKVHCVSRLEAMNLLQNGKIDNAATIIGLQWLALNHERIRQQWHPTSR